MVFHLTRLVKKFDQVSATFFFLRVFHWVSKAVVIDRVVNINSVRECSFLVRIK
jgi:hypothetical protein